MPRLSKPLMGHGPQAQMWRAALGALVGELRRGRGLTQEELAVAVGTSAKMVSAVECGRAVIPSDDVGAFGRALGVPAAAWGRAVLRLVDPWLARECFGTDAQLEAELRRAQKHATVTKRVRKAKREEPCKGSWSRA